MSDNSPATNPDLALSSSVTAQSEDDTIFSTTDDLFSSIYDDGTLNPVQDTNVSQDTANEENSFGAIIANQEVQEESNFKLAEREFDETELEREQQQEEQSCKERKVSEIETGLEETGSDGEMDLIPLTENREWQTKNKHVFILSESGKPIYSL